MKILTQNSITQPVSILSNASQMAANVGTNSAKLTNQTTQQAIRKNENEKLAEIKKFFPILSDSKGQVPSSVPLKNGIPDHPEHQRLYETTVQLQSIFIKQMIASMHKNVLALSGGDDTLFQRSFQEEIFTDMLHQEYAQDMSRSPQFDLARQMYRQLAPALGVLPSSELLGNSLNHSQ